MSGIYMLSGISSVTYFIQCLQTFFILVTFLRILTFFILLWTFFTSVQHTAIAITTQPCQYNVTSTTT